MGEQKAVRDVVVVGGGIAGLAAAWDLRDLDVVVLEAGDRLGGRLRSEPRRDVWLNLGGHVFSGRDSAAGRLIEQTGTVARPVPGTLAALALHGRIVGRGRVETYPARLPLTPGSRVALARSGARLRLAVARYARVAAAHGDEEPEERQRRMLAFMDDRSFSRFIGPLPDDVAAIYRATLNRSSGEPEELPAGYGVGYFHLVWSREGGLSRVIAGGSSRLIEGLAAGLPGKIQLRSKVTSVAAAADGVDVRYEQGGVERTLRARAVVVATPAPAAARIVADLPPDTARALREVRYGPYAAVAFLTDEPDPVPWDGIYALATPHQPFNMLFNMANVLRSPGRPRIRQGTVFAYAGADAGRRMLELEDDAIAAAFTAGVTRLLPHLQGRIVETVVQRWELGLPYPHLGRSALQPALTRPLGRVHLAGDYLGTWYTETAAQTAARAARTVRVALAAEPRAPAAPPS